MFQSTNHQATVPNRLTGSLRTWLTVGAVLFLLKVTLYLDLFCEAFMWPFRILSVVAVLWVRHAAIQFVRTTKFKLKNAVWR